MPAKNCPECGNEMECFEGGYCERLAAGSYYQEEYPDTWYCESCNHYETEGEEEVKEIV